MRSQPSNAVEMYKQVHQPTHCSQVYAHFCPNGFQMHGGNELKWEVMANCKKIRMNNNNGNNNHEPLWELIVTALLVIILIITMLYKFVMWYMA